MTAQKKKTVTVAARDGCVVDSDPLAAILSGFVGSWERTRPKSEGHQRRAVRPVGAIEWLVSESGVSEYRIQKVLDGSEAQVDLGVADALVAAVGCPEVFYDGTLEVKGCCGGSTRPD